MDTSAVRTISAAFVLALIGAIISYLAARATFGLLIGSTAFTCLIAPTLAQRSSRVWIAFAVTVANLVVWVFAIPIVDAVECAIVLLTFTLALVAVRSASLAILIGMIWLSFPVLVRSDAGAWLVTYHPMFAMNGACNTLGIWVEQQILYGLTTLGQDVFYELPSSIWPCVIAHGVIALTLLVPTRRLSKTAPADDAPSDPQTTPTPPPAQQAPRTP
jgi:hypothetical protein